MLATSGPHKGNLFAVKFFDALDRPEWRLGFMREINLLRSFDHPAIIRVYDEGVYKEKYPFLVMEYMFETLGGLYKCGYDMPESNRLVWPFNFCRL